MTLHMSTRPGTMLWAALLALAFAGCHHDDPCPVYVVNHSTYDLEVTISQDSLLEVGCWWEFLAPSDSLFVNYYPSGTVLWVQWDSLGIDTTDVAPQAEATVSGRTTFLFLNDSMGEPALDVVR